jgi:hypothetical protein
MKMRSLVTLVLIAFIIFSCDEDSGEFGKVLKSVSNHDSEDTFISKKRFVYSEVGLPIEIVDSTFRGVQKKAIQYQNNKLVKVGVDTLVYASNQLNSISRFENEDWVLITKFVHQNSRVIKRVDFKLEIQLATFDSLETFYEYDIAGRLTKMTKKQYPSLRNSIAEYVYEYDSNPSPYSLWPADLNLYFGRVSVLNNEIRVVGNDFEDSYRYKYNLDGRPVKKEATNFIINSITKFEYY